MIRWSTVLALVALMSATASLAGTPRASSELKDDDGTRHRAALAFDGLLHTGWAEGEEGQGEGSWIELPFDRTTSVKSVSVWPGMLQKGARTLREYSRPRTLIVTLKDARGKEIATVEERLQDGGLERVGPKRVDIAIEGEARSLRITVKDTYEGGVFTDTYITEVAVNFDDGAAPKIVERLKKYQASAAGERASKANYEQVVELFTKIKDAEFGDRDSLGELMDRAGDGAPYLRKQLGLVPYGYRVQALPPDDSSIKALQKLEDANAIPAFEMAALRSNGRVQKKFQLQVEYFYALQELIGGGDRNIPFWGKSGWEEGALRSFGEPVGIEVDQFGEVHVADIGNHRVVRYATNGRHSRIWGAKPAITNIWFSGTRKFYVAGAEPGDKPGQFSNPVDIDLIPGKEGDGFVVLDATGRVQLYNEEGRAVIGWTVRSNDKLQYGVGGEGYVLYVKGKIVVVWDNEVFVYSKDSEELNHWKTEDGAPNGAQVLKNGKLAFIFGDEIVVYSMDGFRHGTIIEADDIGPGVEDWDLCLDEKKKLWVVTDTGWITKFKKPGKIDFKLRISEVDLVRPRIAVFDSMVYVIERDRILKNDALEMLKKLELAKEKAAEEAAKTEAQ